MKELGDIFDGEPAIGYDWEAFPDYEEGNEKRRDAHYEEAGITGFEYNPEFRMSCGLHPSFEDLRFYWEQYKDREDPLSKDIARRLQKGMLKRATAQFERAKRTSRFKPLTVDQLKAIKPPKYLIEGLLVRNTLAQLFGDWGTGKTFVALNWALEIASAGEHVVYVAAEGGSALQKRLLAWEQEHPDTDISDFFHPVDGAVNLFRRDEVEEFVEQAIKPFKPSFVIFDTLARCSVGADDSPKDGTVIISSADYIRAASESCVLLVNHPGHADKTRSRGASTIPAGVDTDMRLEEKAKIANSKELKLTVVKQKDDRELEAALSLTVVDLKDGGTSCVIRSTGAIRATSEEVKGNYRGAQAVLVLEELLEEPEHEYGISSASWKAAMVERGICGGSTFYTLIKPLENKGQVIKAEVGKNAFYALPVSE